MKLSIIVPTQGRASLTQTLASITAQMLPGDELIVVRDDSGDWGHTSRNKAMRQATGNYLLFMDDDDRYVDGAFAVVRAALAEHPDQPHLFAMHRHHHEPKEDAVLPRTQDVTVGNVSTQMIVVPNDHGKLGTWGSRYEGDFDFIASTLALYPID